MMSTDKTSISMPVFEEMKKRSLTQAGSLTEDSNQSIKDMALLHTTKPIKLLQVYVIKPLDHKETMESHRKVESLQVLCTIPVRKRREQLARQVG